MEPENDKIINKAIIFAKEVILDSYFRIGEGYSQEIRVFIDNERANVTDKLNYALQFYNDKNNIEKELTEEEFHFINDRILGAVKVYGNHLKKGRKNIVSEELDEEIRIIDRLLERFSVEGGNYDLYMEHYIGTYFDLSVQSTR